MATFDPSAFGASFDVTSSGTGFSSAFGASFSGGTNDASTVSSGSAFGSAFGASFNGGTNDTSTTVLNPSVSVIFDGPNRRVLISSLMPVVRVSRLYSMWKEWAAQSQNLGYLPCFRTFGGDPTVSGQVAPAYFFLTYGWRIIVNGFHATFSYNLYTDEGDDPVITQNGGTALLNNSDVGIAKSTFDQALDYKGSVTVSQEYGVTGTIYPIGTTGSPALTLEEAIVIAKKFNVNQINISDGIYTLNSDCDGFRFDANVQSTQITLDGTYDIANTLFNGCTIVGDAKGRNTAFNKCAINNLQNFKGTATDSVISGGIKIAANSSANLLHCASGMVGNTDPVIDMNQGNDTRVAVRGWYGGITLSNCDSINDVATIEVDSGTVTINSSCTAGSISIRGIVSVIDNSNGAVINASSTLANIINTPVINSLKQEILITQAAILDSIQSVSVASSALNASVALMNMTTGTITSGTIADLRSTDANEMTINDVSLGLDFETVFGLGSNAIPSDLNITARCNRQELIQVSAWNITSHSWENIGAIAGSTSSKNTSYAFTLYSDHVDAVGQVKIRFNATANTNIVFKIDQLFISYAKADTTMPSTQAIAAAVWATLLQNGASADMNLVKARQASENAFAISA
jgi:hypothetical protein